MSIPTKGGEHSHEIDAFFDMAVDVGFMAIDIRRGRLNLGGNDGNVGGSKNMRIHTRPTTNYNYRKSKHCLLRCA